MLETLAYNKDKLGTLTTESQTENKNYINSKNAAIQLSST